MVPNTSKNSYKESHHNGFVYDSDSDNDSVNSVYKFQPIPKLPTTPVTASAKRPSVSNDTNPAKKAKTGVSRIWLKDDEIMLLTEMYDFQKLRGRADGSFDVLAFYGRVKWKLVGDYTKDQFRGKVKYMKAKYLGVVKKGGDPGWHADSHEALVFELSRKVWGQVVTNKDNVDVGVAKENRVVDGKNVEDDVMVEEKDEEETEEEVVDVSSYKFLQESVDIARKYQESLGLSDTAFRLMNENLHLIGKENASELDGEWKELFMEELELKHKKAYLIKEQVELVFHRIKKP